MNQETAKQSLIIGGDKNAAFAGVRRSLFGNLLSLVVLIAGPIIGVVLWGSQRTVAELSRNIVNSAIARAHSELNAFFVPVRQNLMVARDWGISNKLDLNDVEQLNTLFIPVLKRNSQLYSLVLANSRGEEYLLVRGNLAWRVRVSRPEELGERRRWLRYDPDGELIEENWEEDLYDPRERSWYRGARSRPEGLPYWTEPFAFRGSGDPGIITSVSWRPSAEGAVEHVVALSVMLKDISQFTSSFKVSPQGQLALMTGDTRVFGLPAEQRFQTEEGRTRAVLTPAAELGIPALSEVVKMWKSDAESMLEPRRHSAGRAAFWSGFRPFDLGSKRRLWIAVTVPESDLVG